MLGSCFSVSPQPRTLISHRPLPCSVSLKIPPRFMHGPAPPPPHNPRQQPPGHLLGAWAEELASQLLGLGRGLSDTETQALGTQSTTQGAVFRAPGYSTFTLLAPLPTKQGVTRKSRVGCRMASSGTAGAWALRRAAWDAKHAGKTSSWSQDVG